MDTGEGEIVIADLEAGVGELLRAAPDEIDLLVVVTDASSSACDVARRLLTRAPEVGITRTTLVANKVLDEDDVAVITGRLGGRSPDAIVPDDRAIALADRHGTSPVDADEDGPGVEAMTVLALRLLDEPLARA